MDYCACIGRVRAYQAEDWEMLDVQAQQFIPVTVTNNEKENRDVYFYLKLEPGTDTLQYGGPVTLIPGQSITQVLPAGVQIDVRIQYYQYYTGIYSYWCRKLWNQAEILHVLSQRGGLMTTTGEIGRSNCSSYLNPTWVTRGSIGEGAIRPEYLLLGITTNNPTPWQILGLQPGASKGEILRSFRALSLKWAEDKYYAYPESVRLLASEIQKLLNNARDALTKF